MTDKKELRKQCLARRNGLSEEDRAAFSKEICEKLLPYLKDRKILSYSPFKSEVDVSSVNRRFLSPIPLSEKPDRWKLTFPKAER